MTPAYYSGARPSPECEYEVRLNTAADVDERGGHVAWEVWHWPTETVDSDWFKASDAYRRVLTLASQDNDQPEEGERA